MAHLPLTLACWNYDRTRPLIDGRVKPDGIALDIKVMRPRQIFPRMLESQEFQVSELSLASYASLMARATVPLSPFRSLCRKFFATPAFTFAATPGLRHLPT
jgi:4,5-dihydroxyphthalate decarboxylase